MGTQMPRSEVEGRKSEDRGLNDMEIGRFGRKGVIYFFDCFFCKY